MNTWYRRALAALAVAALMLTASGCGQSTPASSVGQQLATSAPKQAGVTGPDVHNSGEIWFINQACPLAAPISALAGIDMDSGNTADFDSSVDDAGCNYATPLTDSHGDDVLDLSSSLTPIPEGHPPAGQLLPGETNQDMSRTLGKGAYQTTGIYNNEGVIVTCRLVVPARDHSGRDEGMELKVTERDPSRVDICPTLSSFLGLFAYQAVADSKAPASSGQGPRTSTPTVSPVAPDAGMPAVTPAQCANATTLNDQQAEACFMAKYPIQIPGWTPSQAGCPDDNSLTRPQYFACRQAGDILIP